MSTIEKLRQAYSDYLFLRQQRYTELAIENFVMLELLTGPLSPGAIEKHNKIIDQIDRELRDKH